MPPIVTPELLEPELRAVTRAGGYSTDSDAISHALEVLLVANGPLRLETAVTLYREGEVTLSRAAEVAGLEFESFKEQLARRDVLIRVDEAPERVEEGAESLRQWLTTP